MRTVRLLCVADNTDNWPQRGDGRYCLESVVRSERVDALVSLGDYTPIAAAAMARSGAPCMGVYGNHCTADYMPEHGIFDLIGDRGLPARRTTLSRLSGMSDAVSVLAAQGCVKYKQPAGDVLFTQEQYADAIEHLPAADLVLTHCPPAGINDGLDDAHRGIIALREWVDRHRPRWIMHGHTYGNQEVSTYSGTTVFWINGAAVIDIDVQ